MSPRLKIIGAYALMCAIWGTTWLGIKFGLATLPPITGVAARFLLAGLFMYSVALVLGKIVPLRAMPWKLIVVLSATLFGLNYVLTYFSETGLSSGLVAVLFGTLPFFMFGLGHFMVDEKTTANTWIGAVLAFGGVAVISLAGNASGSIWYILATIGAALSSAFANVYAKRHSDVDPMVVLPPSMLLAGVVLAVAGLLYERPSAAIFTIHALLPVLYLAIFGSGIAFFLNLWLLQRLDAGIVGLSALIIPVIAVFVGIAFGGEQFGARDLIGAALVMGGVWFALRRRSRQPELICPVEG
ncbi:MAG: EamA family transporter [Candidatus Eremiobacteraeota bacterium]|nr:EamA family transporter [Candidatus Eremiobacteraeota bacterium]